MANTAAVCNSFKKELMQGLHALGTCSETRTVSTKDALKGALYLASATVNASTTAYSSTGEVSGTNYTAGGASITNATEPTVTNSVAHWTPSASLTWSNVTLSTAFDALLLYNDQFSTKRAIAVYTFGSQTVNAGNFSLTMPTNNDTSGLLRIS